MIVSIHQPHFFPWLGYLHRMLRSDLFVILDHVQFERQNYQNRVAIKTAQGPRWLSAPVRQRSRSERIIDKQLDDQARGRRAFGPRTFRALSESYSAAPHFEVWSSAVRQVLESGADALVDLDLKSIQLLRSAFGIDTPLLRSSTLDLRQSGAALVLEICEKVGARAFLGGVGASRRYIDPAPFHRAGIEVLWQDFSHPRYPQHPPGAPFIEGLSALDALFNCGAEAGQRLLARGGSPSLRHSSASAAAV